MDTNKGTFIVIEGTDGSGKGTQFELLAEQLKKAGYTVSTFDFPQYGQPSSYFVQQYLNGQYGQANEVGPYTSSLFYALDRYQSAQSIRQALAAGHVVLANRFTGSNMAHQGTKFANPEERRGFFIWLDNLEFEMLKIPRPDISFVLRVPAATAQRLVDEKQTRTYTDKKRDIHEADLEHMERSVAVYDELCQLFPRDFVQIDCMRNDQLLDIESIHRLLWQKASPLLPPPGQLEMSLPGEPAAQASASSETLLAPDAVGNQITPITSDTRASSDYQSAGAPQNDTSPGIVRNVSYLFAAHLLRNHSYIVEVHDRDIFDNASQTRQAAGQLEYVTPKSLDPLTAEEYHNSMKTLLVYHAKIVDGLGAYLQEQATLANASTDLDAIWRQATYAANLVLPTARTVQLHIQSSQPGCDVIQLFNDEVAAFQRATTQNTIDDLIADGLSPAYASAEPGIHLLRHYPRNDFAVLKDLLYTATDQAYDQLERVIDELSYKQKINILDAFYENNPQAFNQALQNTTYAWEIVSDMQTAFGFGQQIAKTHRTIETQRLTPRYGYDMPPLIEAAGLVDDFEACFDISLKLHSQLEQAGYREDAAYATLLGHRARYKLTLSGGDAQQLFHADGSESAVAKLYDELANTIVNRHPLLAKYIVSDTKIN